MRTLTRPLITEQVLYDGKDYKLLSALDRIGYTAYKAGEDVIKVKIVSAARKQQRIMHIATTGKSPPNDSHLWGDDYYYIANQKRNYA